MLANRRLLVNLDNRRKRSPGLDSRNHAGWADRFRTLHMVEAYGDLARLVIARRPAKNVGAIGNAPIECAIQGHVKCNVRTDPKYFTMGREERCSVRRDIQ